MHLVTKKGLIATVAQRYAAAFQRRNQWPEDRDYTQEKQIHTKLESLPDSASELEVTAIVGHNRLTRNTCHQCGIDSEIVAIFCHEKHHALDITPLCPNCLREALALVQNAD